MSLVLKDCPALAKMVLKVSPALQGHRGLKVSPEPLDKQGRAVFQGLLEKMESPENLEFRAFKVSRVYKAFRAPLDRLAKAISPDRKVMTARMGKPGHPGRPEPLGRLEPQVRQGKGGQDRRAKMEHQETIGWRPPLSGGSYPMEHSGSSSLQTPHLGPVLVLA